MDKFDSIINTILNIVDRMKVQPVKSIITLLIVSTIVLVKPIVYYSTLFLEIYKTLNWFFFALVLFGVIHFIIKKKKNIHYDQDTMVLITFYPIAIIIENLIYIKNYSSIITLIYHKDINDFVDNIHYMEYNEHFLQYVLSNFITILSFSIEFFNILMSVYLLFYMVIKMMTDLNNGRPTIQYGFLSYQKEKIIRIMFFIMLTSPWLFKVFIPFFNNIF